MSRPRYAPDDFAIGADRFVFVKFHHARHEIEIDVAKQRASARSCIEFESFAHGFPLLDLDGPAAAWIDGDRTSLREEQPPDRVTCYRTIDRAVAPGRHRLEVVQDAVRWVGFGTDGVDLCLDFLDRGKEREHPDSADRFFLERYLPSNLEFDRHPVRLELRLIGAGVPTHRLLTSGTTTRACAGDWTVEFPAWFCSSSPLVCLLPASRLYERQRRYRRLDGSDVEVVVAGEPKHRATVDDHWARIDGILRDLETRIGRFPFDRYVILGRGNGGMEYAGGCVANGMNLRHETIHNYFGRFLSPVDGNAGWVDEAIAAWCDGDRSQGHPIGRNLGRRSQYARATADGAWQIGARVLDVFDRELAGQGGFEAFLRHWFSLRHGAQFTATSFQEDLERYAGRCLGGLFEEMVYTGD